MIAHGAERTSRQAPELAGEAEPVEDLLVLLAGVRVPGRVEAVAPPSLRDLAQLRYGKRPSRFAPGQPARDVLFRPEEIHRASGEADVAPPVRRRNEAVEEQLAGPVALDGECLAAVGAGGLDAPLDSERRADAEGVP